MFNDRKFEAITVSNRSVLVLRGDKGLFSENGRGGLVLRVQVFQRGARKKLEIPFLCVINELAPAGL